MKYLNKSLSLQFSLPKLLFVKNDETFAHLGHGEEEKEIIFHNHTGISWRNFFHSAIIPPCKVSWVSREAEKIKKLYFTCLVRCFSAKMEWYSKKLQKLSKSIKKLLIFGIFSKFVQFWLENSGPNQLDQLKWIILLFLTPKSSLEAE